MNRFLYCIDLAIKDLVRLRAGTRHHVVIVAGICLPILMLLGLKRGHVEALRRDLVTSPTGRQVTFWSARRGELLSRETLDRLAGELPSVEVIIPETQRVVRLRSNSASPDGQPLELESATLYATRAGDPLLAQLGIIPPSRDGKGVIVGEGVAKALKVSIGDQLTVVLSRGRGETAESAEVVCRVEGVMPTEEHAAAIGYVDIDLLDRFDAYIRGERVPEYGWASARTTVADTYSQYLVFCERSGDLTDDDRRYYSERGLLLTDVTDSPPEPLAELLVDGFAEKLRVYLAQTESSVRDPRSRLRMAPSELSEGTPSDDVVLPWNAPQTRTIGSRSWRMAGLSLPRRTWLREYFRRPAEPFDYEADPMTGRIASIPLAELIWPVGEQQSVRLAVETVVEPPGQAPAATESPAASESTATSGGDAPRKESPKPEATPSQAKPAVSSVAETTPVVNGSVETLVVPANLLAWLTAYTDGVAEFDADTKLFVPKRRSPIYDRARMYARTIDEVPRVVRALADKQFAVMSETGRIAEIHRQDVSLQLLVWVVGTGVFLFGVVTVFSVLMDSTDRKRGVIGILRVMGLSRAGVFVSILLRSMAIGGLAALVSLACGQGLALCLAWNDQSLSWLAWKPVVEVDLQPVDLAIVAAGAMLCCALGAIPPAWRASRLDPFDAIVEGRFR